jgi:hypothetical protein
MFHGITILMFFGDHNPPHFHARYGGQAARIALEGPFSMERSRGERFAWSESGSSSTTPSSRSVGIEL